MDALGKIRVSGEAAHDFIRIMFTADTAPLAEPGGVTPSLLLTGEAEVIDLVLIIRTGPSEYMVTTSPATADEAFAWLSAHGGIRDEKGAVFEGLALSDETEKLANVVLFGEGSTAVLTELADLAGLGEPDGPGGPASGGFAAAPRMGSLTMVQLDTVPTLVLASPVLPREPSGEVFELFCPPEGAQGLINAFLSFPEIDPMEQDEYRQLREQQGTWFAPADDASYTFPNETPLIRLIRTPQDFVGAQALKS
jgi:glycine cleavage system aminomethyltransferase T